MRSVRSRATELGSACPVGVEVVSLDPRTYGEVAASIRLLASRLGVPERGAELADAMLDALAETARAVRGSAETPRVLRRVDRSALLRRALAARDDRGRGRPRRPRSPRRAVLLDELGCRCSTPSPSSWSSVPAASASTRPRREAAGSSCRARPLRWTATRTTRGRARAWATAFASSPTCSIPTPCRTRACRPIRLAGSAAVSS